MEEQKELVPEEKKQPAISINTEILKQKLEDLKKANKELMDKCKFQATRIKIQARELSERASNTKIAIAGKSVLGKVKDLFSKAPKVIPVKELAGFTIGGEYKCVHGFIIDNKMSGYIVVRDGHLVDYDLGDDKFFVTIYCGNIRIPKENVDFIVPVPQPK